MSACPNLSLSRNFAGKPVLVTGGAGFIGGHLCRTLVEGGAEVRVLDDFSSGRRGALSAEIQVIEGDVADETAVRRAARGCTHIFHLAALVSVPLSIEQPELCFRTNVTGTQVVLGVALGEGVRSVVHASSASVYGRQPKLPSSEDDAVQCASPYASSKAEGESLIRMYTRHHGLCSTSLRLFNVFGPGQDPKGPYSAAISAFVEAARARRAPIVYGDGMQTRDFVPIAEVVQAFLRAADAGPRAAGEIFNVGLGEQVTILEVIDMIGDAAGFKTAPQFEPRRAGDVDHSWADLSKIRRVLGYSPTTGLAPALAAFVRGECAAAARA